MNIVIVDDDTALCRSMQIQLETQGHEVACVHSAGEGIQVLEGTRPDLAFVDLQLPDKSGIEVLRSLSLSESEVVAVMITGVQDAKATIEAIRTGAFDYIRKPLDMDAVLVTIEKVARHLARSRPKTAALTFAEESKPHEIVGAHPAIIEVLKQIALLSENRIPVLIQGESGTGKELVARTLHQTSTPEQPFMAVNCSAVVPTLLESELFGHVKGAFTGADADKAGKLEAAAEGSLFLDEIGDMSYDLQAKLLRVLQEREFERVGSTASMPFQARVVAATHRDLSAMVSEGAFREDLYYRLAVSTIGVPALRERRSDLPMLVEHILAQLNRELHQNLSDVEQAALRHLQAYDWPGNVRELINVLTRAVLLSRGTVLTDEAVLAAMGQFPQSTSRPDEIKTLREMEKEHLDRALHSTGWNIKRTSEILGITRVTLRKKISDFHLVKPPGKA